VSGYGGIASSLKVLKVQQSGVEAPIFIGSRVAAPAPPGAGASCPGLGKRNVYGLKIPPGC